MDEKASQDSKVVVVVEAQDQNQQQVAIEDETQLKASIGEPRPPSSASSGSSTVPSLNVEPLHHPQEMAHVEVPHNVENVPHGTTLMNGKALLAKKMAATGTSFYSPSDSLVSPCTQKLTSQKGKRWANAKVKPVVFGKSNLNTTSNSPLSHDEDSIGSKSDSLVTTKDSTS